MLPEWGKEENLRSPWKVGYTHAASLSNDTTQLDLDFRSIFPLSRIDIGDRIYIRTETEPPSSGPPSDAMLLSPTHRPF